MGRLSASVLAAVLMAVPAAGAGAGVVKGTFTVGGKVYTPTHIYALSVPSTIDETKDDIRVVFSVGPQEEGLLPILGVGSHISLTVAIGPGPEGKPEIGFRYANGSTPEKADDGTTMTKIHSWSGMPGVTFVKRAYDPKTNGRVSGTLKIPEDPWATSDPARAKNALTANLEFDVSVLGRAAN